jgi:serine/threonine protein kinase
MESGLVTQETSGEGGELRPRFERYGRYFLVDRLAVGGMAEVYRAVTQGVEGFRRTFVVKRILADKAKSPTFIRMFIDEARICAALHHPNVVQVYDFGSVDGSYFLAMEYLQGKDLSSLMRVLRAAKTSVPPGLAAFVGREAAVGLHYAHTLKGPGGQPLGIVHRDVTPSNIMLLFAGGVKLLDFGIAKAATAASAAGEGDGVKGKFGYLAPEQARNGDVDGRADVFALGVTMWEMLAGRRLFAGKDEVETLRNVLQKPVPPPSVHRPEVPPALDRIVLRALERTREKRYQSADEMAKDCDAVLGTLRADSQTLRAFLNDLFAEESSSLSQNIPELPEELFADMPDATPGTRDERAPSLEIEVVDPTGAHGRTRTPAPPFGVIATDADALERPARSSRLRWIGAVVLAGTVLVTLGLTRQRHAAPPPAAAVVAAPAPVAPAPIAPAPVAPAAVAPAAEPAAAAPAQGDKPSSPDKNDHRPKGHRKKRELSNDMTINPF